MQTVIILILTEGSGPTNSKWATCLASWSTISLPATFEWPGTQISLPQLKTKSFLSTVIVSATND